MSWNLWLLPSATSNISKEKIQEKNDALYAWTHYRLQRNHYCISGSWARINCNCCVLAHVAQYHLTSYLQLRNTHGGPWRPEFLHLVQSSESSNNLFGLLLRLLLAKPIIILGAHSCQCAPSMSLENWGNTLSHKNLSSIFADNKQIMEMETSNNNRLLDVDIHKNSIASIPNQGGTWWTQHQMVDFKLSLCLQENYCLLNHSKLLPPLHIMMNCLISTQFEFAWLLQHQRHQFFSAMTACR